MASRGERVAGSGRYFQRAGGLPMAVVAVSFGYLAVSGGGGSRLGPARAGWAGWALGGQEPSTGLARRRAGDEAACKTWRGGRAVPCRAVLQGRREVTVTS